MKFFTFAFLTAAILFAGPVTEAKGEDMSPQKFANSAASSDMFEIQSSQLALQRSDNPEVKEFADVMIRDHQKASEQLKAAAQKDGVSVPPAMLDKHKETLQALEAATDNRFDKDYIQAQLSGHQEALALVTSYAEAGSGALRSHAEAVAPTIQHHLEQAQQVEQDM